MPHPTWTALSWLNEPSWTVRDDALIVQTSERTDFWRETHYGFIRDSGHVMHTPPMQEFTAQVRVRGRYEALYDQAGLMLRADPACWVKTGVEYVSQQQLSAVVTREYSDWNVCPAGMPEHVDLRMTRRGDAVSIQTRLPGLDWQLLRLTYFPPERPAVVGVYACSPERGGFEVTFEDFRLGEPDASKPY